MANPELLQPRLFEPAPQDDLLQTAYESLEDQLDLLSVNPQHVHTMHKALIPANHKTTEVSGVYAAEYRMEADRLGLVITRSWPGADCRFDIIPQHHLHTGECTSLLGEVRRENQQLFLDRYPLEQIF